MKHLDGRVAAITGAGNGIGRALALELARQGCDLALSDVDTAALRETRALAEATGRRVTVAEVDVSEWQQVAAWAATAATDHGRINLIINNAGVAFSGSVTGASLDDYRWVTGVNYWGVIHGTQAFLPYLVDAGEGHVVNISSVFGLFAQPGMSAYNATKFAVRGFTESLRQELELAPCGVSATCVYPGGVSTGIARRARLSPSIHGLMGAGDDRTLREDFQRRFLRKPPEHAARAIIRGVRRDARRVLIGGDARAADLMQRLMPAAYQRLVLMAARRARQQARAR
ncbi:SDR family NAD(P)-dependent oxidoreductase [Aquisalimonas asiatica]|uniref:Short-chain dehydrogenase n=1 Tax=Aquisalimonas asiatica TaxID=406100 RepID=A0A1H8V7H4_9GAMM|nr:SDR family NAD(P)-dependent oxidoreductase [Aquisalimonas asiatica]SEP11356.1 Short-chain dehydrogenase [Aquisalimonas asiatica]